MARDIDIDHPGIDELVALNERVVERIQYLERLQVHEAMKRFNTGARVRFYLSEHGSQTRRLTQFNQKAVTILGNDQRQWRVTPKIVAPSR